MTKIHNAISFSQNIRWPFCSVNRDHPGENRIDALRIKQNHVILSADFARRIPLKFLMGTNHEGFFDSLRMTNKALIAQPAECVEAQDSPRRMTVNSTWQCD
jgi:hypothetical protein